MNIIETNHLTKRSKIVLLLSIAPLLVVVSGVSSLKMYMTENFEQAWPAYPFCYSGVMVSAEMYRLTNGMAALDVDMNRLLLSAIPILLGSVLITTWRFGKKEMA